MSSVSQTAAGNDLVSIEAQRGVRGSLWQRTLIDLVRNPMGLTGLVIVAALLLLGVLAPMLATHDPIQQFRGHRLEGPSSRFLLGTDEFSRDLFSRVLYGLRASLLISIGATFVGGGLGVVVGYAAGYLRGLVEALIMRFVDTMLAFPGLLLAIGIIAAFGAGFDSLAFALGIAAFPRFARLGRALMLAEAGQDYVLAARVLGASRTRIIMRHVAINTLPALLVNAALAMSAAVLVEASLGYLGLGVTPPQPSLGSLINDGRRYLDHAYYLLTPCLCLALFLLGLNLLADAANESLDPHRRRR